MTKVTSLNDLDIELGWHDRISGDNDLQIYYAFSKKRKGKKEKMKITYETISGEEGMQIFEFTHGLFDVKRLKKK